MIKLLFASLLFTATAQLVNSQVPPRLSIPGALAVGGPVTYRPQHRNEKLVRVRRPQTLRATNSLVPQLPHRLEESKPVTETEEDQRPDIFLPQLLREQQLAQTQQSQFQQQASAFFQGEPDNSHDVFGSNGGHQLVEELSPQTASPYLIPQPSRQPPQAAPQQRPSFNDYGIGRFGGERPQAQPSAQPIPQPQHPRPNLQRRPQIRQQYDAPAPQPAQRHKTIASRPILEQNQLDNERDQNTHNRQQQSIAQTIRKWREENEDGSITWGYENDDGSFKEELIGIDCVTKGTYGYIDPDGNKREYHYETGNKCDPNTRETEEEADENAAINYEDNTAVLPNGVAVNMSQLGKKKSKRPGAHF